MKLRAVCLVSAVLALIFGLARPVGAQQRMPQQIFDDHHRLANEVATLQPALPAAPTYVTVQPGGNVQAALNAGGEVRLTAGASYTGSFVVPSGATLNGQGAKVTASGVEAIIIPPSTVGATVKNIVLASSHNTVLRCGSNSGSQTTEAQIPSGIQLDNVSIPKHRGLRAIEFHCQGNILNPHIRDVYNPNGRDSQGIFIMTGKNINILGGYIEAGSENILVGGDLMKIPGFVPSNIVVENVTLQKRLSWNGYRDPVTGNKVKAKNLFELKTGRNVTLRNCILDGSWTDAQEGWAIVITPHSAGDIHDVLIEGNRVTNAATFLDLIGKDYGIPTDAGGMIPTPAATSGVVIRNNYVSVSKTMVGRGIIAVLVAAPQDVTFDGNVFITDGDCLIIYDQGKVLQADGTNVPGGPMGTLTFTRNYALASDFGFSLGGNQNGANWSQWIGTLTVTGNTFGDPTSWVFKRNFPANVYTTRASWDALVAAPSHAARPPSPPTSLRIVR